MKIAWTRLALSDLDEAYNYIAANNPSAALSIRSIVLKGQLILLSNILKVVDLGEFLAQKNWLLAAHYLFCRIELKKNRLRF